MAKEHCPLLLFSVLVFNWLNLIWKNLESVGLGCEFNYGQVEFYVGYESGGLNQELRSDISSWNRYWISFIYRQFLKTCKLKSQESIQCSKVKGCLWCIERDIEVLGVEEKNISYMYKKDRFQEMRTSHHWTYQMSSYISTKLDEMCVWVQLFSFPLCNDFWLSWFACLLLWLLLRTGKSSEVVSTGST